VYVRADAVAEVEALQTNLNAYLSRVEAMFGVDEFDEAERVSFVAVMFEAINLVEWCEEWLAAVRDRENGWREFLVEHPEL